MSLTFTEADHAYYWEGKRVPNVTSIIGPLVNYSRIPPDRLELARQKGVATHKMVEADAKGTLIDIPEWMEGLLIGWLKFREDTGFRLIASEEKVYSTTYRYAGTFDLACELPKLPKLKKPVLIDIKRSLYGGPAIGLQTAAYKGARNPKVPKDERTDKRFALVLKEDGKYQLTPYDDPDDFSTFLACLQQHRWRQKYLQPQEATP